MKVEQEKGNIAYEFIPGDWIKQGCFFFPSRWVLAQRAHSEMLRQPDIPAFWTSRSSGFSEQDYREELTQHH